jgi:hypothetical protein
MEKKNNKDTFRKNYKLWIRIFKSLEFKFNI